MIRKFDVPFGWIWKKNSRKNKSSTTVNYANRTICDYRLRTGSSVAGEPLSAYKRMNVEPRMEMAISYWELV